MKYFFSKLKLDWKWGLFFLAIAVGVFFRAWHFSDWLYFKRDEARDAFIIWKACTQGPGWLPLLGPNATGATFFTGAVYYYFQYLAALVFQSARPAVLAFPDLFFSLLTIPVAYFFLKKFFSRGWSMILTALFSVDFLAVQYSRFAWNPNTLPFFHILFLLALLNVFDAKEKKPLLWSAVAGMAFALGAQLHALSLVALPIILLAFLLLKVRDLKKYLNLKKIAVFFAIVILLYIPMIIHEILTHGRNTDGFLAGISREPYYASFAVNIFTEAVGIGHNWLLILSGYISPEVENRLAILTWAFFILPGVYFLLKTLRSEKSENKKNFALVVALWLAAYLAVYFPVALHMQVRFFLPIILIPVIFLGLVLDFLWEKKNIFLKGFSLFIVAAAIAGNIWGVSVWFSQMASAEKGFAKADRTIILKEQDGIVLWHLDEAAEYMEQNCPSRPIYIYTNFEYYTPLQYVFTLRGVDSQPLEAYDAARPGCIFMFDPSNTGRGNFSKELSRSFDVARQKYFGVLNLRELEPKENADLAPFLKEQKPKRDLMIYWRNVFGAKK